MSLAKAAPGGLKDCECKKMALRKHSLIPYVPRKDSVQETVSSFKDNHLKTLINKGTELQVPIWHSGTREAFLIHLETAREATKKRGRLYGTRMATNVFNLNEFIQFECIQFEGIQFEKNIQFE